MKVSIIVPIYNVEKYIVKCIQSLFEQTYDDIEYIFVDDCSPDNSVKLLKSTIENYPNRKNDVKIIRHAENKGLSTARKTGILSSTGDYIYHIDSDDWIEPESIQLLMSTATDEKADMVVGNFILEFEHTSKIKKMSIPSNKYEYVKSMLLRDRNYPWNLWNRLIKRDLQLKIMPIDNLNMGEDFATVPRLCAITDNIKFVDKCLYHYRQTNNASYTKNISYKSYIDLVTATDILCNFFVSSDQKDYFKTIIPAIRLKTKVGLYMIGNDDIRKSIQKYYPDDGDFKYLSVSEKILIILGRYELWSIMSFFVSAGLNIKKILNHRNN